MTTACPPIGGQVVIRLTYLQFDHVRLGVSAQLAWESFHRVALLRGPIPITWLISNASCKKFEFAIPIPIGRADLDAVLKSVAALCRPDFRPWRSGLAVTGPRYGVPAARPREPQPFGIARPSGIRVRGTQSQGGDDCPRVSLRRRMQPLDFPAMSTLTCVTTPRDRV